MRSHTCSDLTSEDIGKRVSLCGWVHRRRNFGQLLFIDLRDRRGITQLVIDQEHSASQPASEVRAEWVVRIEGTVQKRQSPNAMIKTGDIEVAVDNFTVLSKAETPPFEISGNPGEVSEELRLKRRFLDMRRGPIMDNLALRHKAMLTIRHFLDRRDFIEVNTPILSKSSPEGARDYLVPSRVHLGKYYALPQSPQLFKQMLMAGGCDRYFQIAPCFRDEDLRADRQPEFYQIDIEMSFGERAAIFELAEQLVATVYRETLGIEIKTPFPKMTHKEALERFGTDKPDMRFGMEIIHLDHHFQKSDCAIFKKALESGGVIRAIVARGGASWSRKVLDGFTEMAKEFGLGGIAWVKKEGEIKSPLAKFFDVKALDTLGLEEGDCALIAAGQAEPVLQTLDHLRRTIGHDQGLMDTRAVKPLWVVDFPLFMWDEEEKRYVSCHHPFTAPLPGSDGPLHKMLSSGYDLVINGYEVAGGSVRIHDIETQLLVFEELGIGQEEAEEKFGALLSALKSGIPPHLGIAFGLERLMMLLAGTENIRDVIAFPKTTKASDLMMEAPSDVSREQLRELGLK